MKPILSIIAAAFALSASAQHFADPNSAVLRKEEAKRLTNEEFYFGSQNLNASGQATRLINDYYLNTPGTADNISRWLQQNPIHPDRTRLRLMQANLMVKSQDYASASQIYDNATSEEFGNLPQKEQTEANLYSAIACLQTDDYNAAERKLASIMDSPTHQPDIYYYAGYTQYVKGNYKEAANYFTAVEQSKEYGKKAPVYIADCLLQSGQPQDALDKARTWIASNGSNSEMLTEARRIAGEAEYDLGRYPGAAETLQTYAVSAAQPKRTALYKLGMSQFHLQQYADAAKMLSKSAGVASDAMAQSAWLNAGKAYISTQNKRQASIAFQQAAQMNADPATKEEAAYNYALTLHQGAEMGFGESVTEFERFLNNYPNSQYASSVAQHLTEVYFTTKNYPAALKSINKIKKPSADIIAAKQQVLYNMGTQAFANGDYRSAKELMTQSNATLATPEAIFWKGESEYRLGDLTAAARDYNSYIKNGKNLSNKALANYGLGYINFKNKKYTAALSNFNNYLTGCPNGANADRKSLKADAYNRIGDCLFTQRKFDEADQAYGTSLLTDKTHGDYSLLQMAMISGLKGNYQHKVELLNQLETTYNNSEYADNALFEQGRAYVLSGDRQKAQDTFSSLIAKYPNSTNARRAKNEIGMIFQENGQTDLAIQQYTTLIDQHKDTEEAAAALESLKQIYNAQGKVNEYAAIAQRAGKSLSPEELDEMTENAAVIATANGEYAKALDFYRQIDAQTLSEDMKAKALQNGLELAGKAGNKEAELEFASKILDGTSKISPDKVSQARLIRAQNYMANGYIDPALQDYKELANDNVTVYGAQGTVELAQYLYDTQQYQEAESRLDTFIDNGTPYPYWLARAFILLSDVYSKTGRDIEAHEYLLSLKSNYSENAEINQMIEERLKKE